MAHWEEWGKKVIGKKKEGVDEKDDVEPGICIMYGGRGMGKK